MVFTLRSLVLLLTEVPRRFSRASCRGAGDASLCVERPADRPSSPLGIDPIWPARCVVCGLARQPGVRLSSEIVGGGADCGPLPTQNGVESADMDVSPGQPMSQTDLEDAALWESCPLDDAFLLGKHNFFSSLSTVT